jgi:GxxExxY protein
MELNDITGQIIDSAINIHKKLGPGLLESVYEEMLHYELVKRGLFSERQVPSQLYMMKLEWKLASELTCLWKSK